MKKSLALLAVLGCFSQSSMAANLNFANLTGATAQTSFNAITEEFGAALSYKPVTPAAPLGITGFDIGVEVSSTDLSPAATTAWNALIPSSSNPGSLIIPKLTVAKGLPFDIDVSAFYSAIPSTNVSVMGAAISYAIIGGDMVLPAVTVRGAMTTLSGVDQFSFGTKSVDISVSKGFFGFTPYAGVGQVWVDSSTTVAGLQAVSLTPTKAFVGLNFNLGLPNFAIEADQTGSISTYSAKFGLRW